MCFRYSYVITVIRFNTVMSQIVYALNIILSVIEYVFEIQLFYSSYEI